MKALSTPFGIVLVATFAACSNNIDPGPSLEDEDSVARTGPAAAVAETPGAVESKAAIASLIPAAAGIPNDSYERFLASTRTHTPSIEAFDTRPLTTGLVFSRLVVPFHGIEEAIEARRTEFSWSEKPFASKISDTIGRSVPKGYYTAVQPDFMKELTCQVSGNTAAGMFRLEIPDIGKGRIQYTAEYKGDNWRITEFRLPVHNWKFAVTNSGKWKWYDFFGDTEDPNRFPPAQELTGSVMFEGQPVNEARITAYHMEAPELHRLQWITVTDGSGNFAAALPAGRYAIEIRKRGITGKYKRRDGAKVVIRVEEGKNQVALDLVESEPHYKY